MSARTKLVLDRPCDTAGRSFEEREGGRFCAHCEELQYDLREATRSEVLALVRSQGGRICGRLRLGPSGEPRFRAEPPARGTSALGAALVMTLAACETPSETVTPEPASATAPPTTVAAPPATELAAPAPPTVLPPTSVAPPTSIVAPTDDGIDHSTDASRDPADHRQHRHHHPVVRPTPEEQYDGGIGVMPDDF